MKTPTPSHDAISQRAQKLWEEQGRPHGRDAGIWLEAERQLSTPAEEENDPSSEQGRGDGRSQKGTGPMDPKSGASAPGQSSANSPAPSPGEAAAKAEQQKAAARAPKFPATNAPKPLPAESGKPLWDKPHSS